MAGVGDIIKRVYTNFRGIDLLNPENSVDIRRSPDCLNVWKSYSNVQSNIIETRPGIKKIISLEEKSKIHSIYIWKLDTAIIHIGNKLIRWIGFPTVFSEIKTIYEDMNDLESQFFFFKDCLYIIDGKNYLKYDGSVIKKVEEEAYIPTTTIGRAPSGGGEPLEDVNVLTGERKNTFIADGKSKDYYLDAVDIDYVSEVKINDEIISNDNYTVDNIIGKVSFKEVPKEPDFIGKDNVEIKFCRKIKGYKNRIEECKIATVFDNRVFFSGNTDYSNAVFHCSLNNPAYISDLDYYECGSKNNMIRSLVVGNNLLWVFKNENQNKDTIYFLSPTNESDYGRVYPTSQGNVSTGCYVSATNYKDNLIFLSQNGLESINGNIEYEQSLSHKSSMIDAKLINMSNYEFSKMSEYKDYLLIAIDNYVFLADYRQQFTGTKGNEYEWYLWKMPIIISCIKKYNEKLYFGDIHGNIYVLDGTNDLGEAIESYWTIPRDDFGYTNHLKKINKRGAILKLKNVQNGKVKIAGKTNKAQFWTFIKESSTNGFDFNSINFSNFTFNNGENFYVVFRFKRKKIIDVALKVYSDELDKPFGLQSITLEAFLGGYVKRS